MTTVAVIPAGQWGTALAIPAADNGHAVRLWSRRQGWADAVNASRQNLPYLPDVTLPENVTAHAELATALAGADLVILASASHALREVCRQIRPLLEPRTLLLSVVKGIEPGTHLRYSEVIAQEIPEATARIAVLSGPNFAVEVARRMPTGTVVSSQDLTVAERVQQWLMTPRFRVYTNGDLIGVELAGALKNVMAIGVGMSEGLEMGYNANATLLTRGIREMARVGTALGANAMTFAGLAGIGDLVLTCTGLYSRNRRCGVALGRGQSLTAFLAEQKVTVEGVPTARAAMELARAASVDMPITEQIYRVLYEGLDPRAGVIALMGRGRTHEMEDLTL